MELKCPQTNLLCQSNGLTNPSLEISEKTGKLKGTTVLL